MRERASDVARQKVHIVGIGDDGPEGLTSAARALVAQADIVAGPERSLVNLSAPKAEKIRLGGDFDGLLALIEKHPDRRVVVLAPGDPLFYGTARYLCDRLGKDRFEVEPHVSSMQLAFARVKESWDEAFLTNLANHSLDRVIEKIRTAEKVGLFTSEEVPPAAVAAALLDRKIDYFTAYVCENLGSPDERVTSGDLADVAEQQFSPLNVMILVRRPNAPDRPSDRLGRRLFGNPDEAFLQSKSQRGLLTPAEVRAMALAQLDLGPRSIVWDVGAGSGPVAIEAALLAPEAQVFAIEMSAEDCQLIATNAERFGATNLSPILGQAPQVFENLPDPDAVFVGGTGRTVGRLAEMAYDRLRPGGRVVVNVGSIESLAGVRESLQAKSGDAKVWMINIARGSFQLERMRFESVNPTFLIGAVKPVK